MASPGLGKPSNPSRRIPRLPLALLLFLAGSFPGGTAVPYNRQCATWLENSCAMNSDPVKEWNKLVRKSFRGQEHAVEMVGKAFKISTYLEDNPTFLHFSGPTGVGKSFLAQLLAQAVFKYPSCGFLQLQMSIMMKQVNQTEQNRMVERYLLRPIADQLAMCPNSIIVIDEIQFLDDEFLRRLKGFFDVLHPEVMCTTGPNEHRRISTRGAFFIVTSDLDTKAKQLSPNMEIHAADKIIRELARGVWGDQNHMASMATLVPFLPLSKAQLVQIAQSQLEYLQELVQEVLTDKVSKTAKMTMVTMDWIGSLRFAEDLPSKIVESQREKTNRFGARPIKHYIQINVYPLAIEIADELMEKGSKSQEKSVGWFKKTSQLSSLSPYIPSPWRKVYILNDVEITIRNGDEFQYYLEVMSGDHKRKSDPFPKDEL